MATSLGHTVVPSALIDSPIISEAAPTRVCRWRPFQTRCTWKHFLVFTLPASLAECHAIATRLAFRLWRSGNRFCCDCGKMASLHSNFIYSEMGPNTFTQGITLRFVNARSQQTINLQRRTASTRARIEIAFTLYRTAPSTAAGAFQFAEKNSSVRACWLLGDV